MPNDNYADPVPQVRRWMRQRELAEWLSISDRMVRRLTAEGRIPVARVGRVPLYDADAVAERLMAEGL